MSEVRSNTGILDVIKRITANRESGRLEIGSAETRGSGTHGSGTGVRLANAFSVDDLSVLFDPGLCQPWADISERRWRLRSEQLTQTAGASIPG